MSGGRYDPTISPALFAPYRIPGATYFDLGLTAKVKWAGHQADFFFNIGNVLDKDPVIVPQFTQTDLYAPINPAFYDSIGRDFRFGIRWRL